MSGKINQGHVFNDGVYLREIHWLNFHEKFEMAVLPTII